MEAYVDKSIETFVLDKNICYKVLYREYVDKYAAQIVDVLNQNLPAYFPLVSEADIRKEAHIIDNGNGGNVIDLRQRWMGTSIGVFDKDRLVGLGLSSVEAVYDDISAFDEWSNNIEYNSIPTGRGRFTNVAINPEYRGTNVPAILMIAVLEALYRKGCNEVFASTSTKSEYIHNMYKKYAESYNTSDDDMRRRYRFTPKSTQRIVAAIMGRSGSKEIIESLLAEG